jgi:hypothetical protein
MKWVIIIAICIKYINANVNCIETSNLWYDVCDYDNQECIVSNAICGSYGSLPEMISGAARVKPTQEKPWTFWIDPYDRTNTNVCSNKNAKECVKHIKDDFGTINNPDFNEFSFTNAVISMNDVTIKCITFDINQQVRIQLKGEVSVNTANLPKCRVFEVLGSRVTLQGFRINGSACLSYYKTPDQYVPDDGVYISFSGKNVLNSKVHSVTFIGPSDYRLVPGKNDAYSPPTTAIRVQNYEYGTTDATGFVAENIELNNVNYSIIMWDYAAREAPKLTFVHYNKVFTNVENPIAMYKMGFTDAKEPRLTNTGEFPLLNVSGLISPTFSFFRPSVMRLPIGSNVNRCSYIYAEAALGLFGSLVVILLIIIFAREAYTVHSDALKKHLEAARAKQELHEMKNQNTGLVTTQPPSYSGSKIRMRMS